MMMNSTRRFFARPLVRCCRRWGIPRRSPRRRGDRRRPRGGRGTSSPPRAPLGQLAVTTGGARWSRCALDAPLRDPRVLLQDLRDLIEDAGRALFDGRGPRSKKMLSSISILSAVMTTCGCTRGAGRCPRPAAPRGPARARVGAPRRGAAAIRAAARAPPPGGAGVPVPVGAPVRVCVRRRAAWAAARGPWPPSRRARAADRTRPRTHPEAANARVRRAVRDVRPTPAPATNCARDPRPPRRGSRRVTPR